jgi:hypothetical protein
LTPEDARDLLLGIIEQVITDETRVLAEPIVKVSSWQINTSCWTRSNVW